MGDFFQSFPQQKFRQSAADPPRAEADCVGNFYSTKIFLADSASEAIGPTRTYSYSGGLNRSPPRNCSATKITQFAKSGRAFCWRTLVDCFLADRPPVDGGSDQVDSEKVRLSPPGRTLWRIGWRIRSGSDRIHGGLNPPIIVPKLGQLKASSS